MRRLFLLFVLVAGLAGCSSGSSNVASSTKSTSPTGASSTFPKGASSTAPKAAGSTAPKAAGSKSATKSPPLTKVSVGAANSFCAAFKEMQSVKASAGPAAAGAAYQTIAAEMRKYAPAAIKDAAGSYADVIDESGKALKSNTMPTSMAGTSKDLATVTVWVSKNCKLK